MCKAAWRVTTNGIHESIHHKPSNASFANHHIRRSNHTAGMTALAPTPKSMPQSSFAPSRLDCTKLVFIKHSRIHQPVRLTPDCMLVSCANQDKVWCWGHSSHRRKRERMLSDEELFDVDSDEDFDDKDQTDARIRSTMSPRMLPVSAKSSPVPSCTAETTSAFSFSMSWIMVSIVPAANSV